MGDLNCKQTKINVRYVDRLDLNYLYICLLFVLF